MKSEVLIVLNIEVMVSCDMMPFNAHISSELAVGIPPECLYPSANCGIMSQKTIIIRLHSVPFPCLKNGRDQFSFLTVSAVKDQWTCTLQQ